MWNTDRIVHAVGLFYIVQSVMLTGVAVYAGSWGLALPAVTGLPVAFALLYVRKKQKNRERRMLSALKGKEASLLEAEEIWLSEELCQIVEGLLREQQEQSRYYQGKYAEYLALQTQINPHFLYNTLDAINWMAVKKEEYEISRMVSNLGFILRYSINKKNERVSMSDVEEWLRAYVPLYQLRYGNSFEFQIYVENSVKEQKIHKFLIQPIVENAILHGIKDMEGALLQVNIALEEQSGRIHIIVEDNGIGMEKNKIDIYNQRDRTWTGTDRIGLANVFERIQLYYGEKGEWHISSVEGMGTVMELLLPPEDRESIQEKVIE